MKVRKLSDVMKEFPGFHPGWIQKEDGGLENPKFGSVERVVICKDDGNPIFDQYEIWEKGGAIVVPYYFERQIRVGLISLIRVVVADPKTGEQGSVVSVETPRGFSIGEEVAATTAIRELGEETQRVVRSLELIGRVNPNTAFYGNFGIPVFAIEVDREKFSNLQPEATEKIFQCTFYTKQEIENLIREQIIFCGLTKSSLMDFFSTIG